MALLSASSMRLARAGVGRAACIVALIAGAADSAGAQRQGLGSAMTLPEARKFLEGRWVLESYEVRPPGKAPIILKGTGVLTFDDFANLHMEVHADEPSADLLRAAGINMRDGVISSDGRVAIDLQNRTLTYFLEGQPSSTLTGGGPLAMNRPRHWEVTGDTLTLSTKDENGAPLSIGRWKRSK
jgi:hypothetical protein